MEKIQRSDILRGLSYIGICVLAVLFTLMLSKPRKVDIPPNTSPIPPVEELKDKNGNQVALIKQYAEERERNKILIDSLSSALNIKPKYIQGVDRIVVKVDTLFKEKVVYIPASLASDSTTISFKDRYVDILAVGKIDSSYINFRLTPDTLTRVHSYKNPLFGRPSTDIMLRHSNPYFRTTHGSSFTLEQRKPIFSVGVSVGYDVINQRVSFGPSVTVPVKTFYKK